MSWIFLFTATTGLPLGYASMLLVDYSQLLVSNQAELKIIMYREEETKIESSAYSHTEKTCRFLNWVVFISMERAHIKMFFVCWSIPYYTNQIVPLAAKFRNPVYSLIEMIYWCFVWMFVRRITASGVDTIKTKIFHIKLDRYTWYFLKQGYSRYCWWNQFGAELRRFVTISRRHINLSTFFIWQIPEFYFNIGLTFQCHPDVSLFTLRHSGGRFTWSITYIPD